MLAGTPYIFVLERVLTFVLFDIFIAIKIVCTHPLALCVSNILNQREIFCKVLRQKKLLVVSSFTFLSLVSNLRTNLKKIKGPNDI